MKHNESHLVSAVEQSPDYTDRHLGHNATTPSTPRSEVRRGGAPAWRFATRFRGWRPKAPRRLALGARRGLPHAVSGRRCQCSPRERPCSNRGSLRRAPSTSRQPSVTKPTQTTLRMPLHRRMTSKLVPKNAFDRDLGTTMSPGCGAISGTISAPGVPAIVQPTFGSTSSIHHQIPKPGTRDRTVLRKPHVLNVDRQDAATPRR